MPLNYARRLTGRERTAEANVRLGFVLAFVAGATNAGGFLAVHQYTSHMTGIVSAMADHLVLGAYDVWRQVRTVDGTTGWMSASMLIDQRTVLVTGRERAPLYGDPEARAKVVAYAMPGAVARLDACVPRACKISATGLKGWIGNDRIWGADRDEVFK